MRSFFINAASLTATASFAAFSTLATMSRAGYKPAQDFLLDTAVKMGAVSEFSAKYGRKDSLTGVEGWTVAAGLLLPAMIGLTFVSVKAYTGARSYFFPRAEQTPETQPLVRQEEVAQVTPA